MSVALAPAIAVAGPANSGKTTLLHMLNAGLVLGETPKLAYVVKGNPDGTGRYLEHAPELRRELEARVKGKWAENTPAKIRQAIAAARRQLEMVLVDLGGKHAPNNREILGECTHAFVLARAFDDPDKERIDGMDSWVRECEGAGLETIARIRWPGWDSGEPSAAVVNGCVTGTFRGDAGRDQPVVRALLDRLRELPAPEAPRDYLNLNLNRRWELKDVADLGGLSGRLGKGSVRLGGPAPVYAYLRALLLTLEQNADCEIEVFDPKLPLRGVRIPRRYDSGAELFPRGALELRWQASPGAREAELCIDILIEDRMLPVEVPLFLPVVPAPPPVPAGIDTVFLNGALPLWLHLAYARWLWVEAGIRRIGVWDASTRQNVACWSERAAAV